MESCLMKYFVLNTELKNSCECNPALFEEAPSLYEVIRVEDGIPLFLEDHIKRFFQSGKLYNKTVPVTERQIVSRIKALIEANGLVTGLIKFIYLNHPVAGNLFAAWVTPFFFPSNEMALHGVDTLTLSGERHKPNAKISHQTVRRQADEIIKTKGVYEVILVNGNGVVTEGSRSNLFFVKHGILKERQYIHGEFLALSNEKASELNEQNRTLFENNKFSVVTNQIAGFITRRIVSFVNEGKINLAQRYGMIMFGSQVDIYVPKETTIQVIVGEKIKAGENIIGFVK
jgi:hypothetical protein